MAPELGLLDALDEGHRRAVLMACTRRKYRRGDTLFHQGDPGDSLHLLVKGHVAIRVLSPQGDSVTLAVLGKGESFGEQALVSDDSLRTASAVALDAVETLVLHRRDFDDLRRSDPRVDRLLVAVLAAQVRRLSDQVVDALYASVESRVARRLSDLTALYDVGEVPIEIPITQEDLASLSGATRPTVNRVLQDFVARGIAQLTRGRIQVVDPARLATHARRA